MNTHVHTHTHTYTHTNTHTHRAACTHKHYMHAQKQCHYCSGSFTPSANLQQWRDKNCNWLELMEAHTQETSGVRVTVMPFYMGRKELHSGSMGECDSVDMQMSILEK